MEDLIRIFVDKLRNRPEPAFNPGAWNVLEARLAEVNVGSANQARLWKMISFALLALLLISNAWHWLKVDGNLLWQSSIANNRSLRVDTLYCTDWIVEHDTLYIDREKYTSKPEVFTEPAFSIQDDQQVVLTDSIHSNYRYKQLYHVDSLYNTNRNFVYFPEHAIDSIYAGDIALPEFSIIPQKGLHLDASKVIAALEPMKTYVGFGGGLVQPLHNKITPLLGYSEKIIGHIQISPSIWLNLEAGLISSRYETGELMTGIPYVTPPTDQFVFSKAEVPKNTLQYGAGFQYFLTEKKRVRPYFGLSLLASKNLTHEVTYEFINTTTEIEYSQDISIPKDRYFRPILGLQAGLSFRLSPYFSGLLQVEHQSPIHSNGNNVTRYIGIKTGLLYRLQKK